MALGQLVTHLGKKMTYFYNSCNSQKRILGDSRLKSKPKTKPMQLRKYKRICSFEPYLWMPSKRDTKSKCHNEKDW